MSTHVAKWGNSLALRIPADLAEKAAFKQGTEVRISIDKRARLIVEPVHQRASFSDLFAAITPENRHGEIASGPELGKEEIE